VDLDPQLRRRVLDAHRDLEQKGYYALLGIEESADRKAVKRAYYELAALFHPDRYFRKRLGSFKLRMEAVFARLTLAHDTLSNRETRSEYDKYLSEQRISQAIEEHLARGLSQASQATESIERTVRAQEEAAKAAPAPAASAAPPPPPARSSPQVDVGARRDALARRLLGGHRPASSSAVERISARPEVGREPAPGAIPREPANATDRQPTDRKPAPMATNEAMDALRRRYEERMTRAKSSEARKFASQAEAAMAAGDLVAAANAFRIASNLTTDDKDLERRAAEARTKADALLAETYTKQAMYEESHSQWPEAARSWGRVCKVRPNDANAHDRAGNATIKSAGDLHEAARFAKRACELEPKNPFYRITLAQCYAAAGLALNARRELDTATQLAPHDDTIQAMIKRMGLAP
jgi:curved DNA-binding protein CbpA